MQTSTLGDIALESKEDAPLLQRSTSISSSEVIFITTILNIFIHTSIKKKKKERKRNLF